MEIKIRELRKGEGDEIYEQLIQIFEEFYVFLESIGLKQNLVEGGGRIWLRSIEKQLGTLVVVFLALEGEKIVGFSAGNLRLNPKFLKANKVGYLSHIYVNPGYRKAKMGRALVAKVESWFREKEVSRIETGVLNSNIISKTMFDKLGFVLEYVVMTKENDPL